MKTILRSDQEHGLFNKTQKNMNPNSTEMS